MYAIIRIGTNYELVIVVSPGDVKPGSEGAKFYRYAIWQIGQFAPRVFHSIDRDTASSYFSGQADALGFVTPPKEMFKSLDEVVAYIEAHRIFDSHDQDFEVEHGGEG